MSELERAILKIHENAGKETIKFYKRLLKKLKISQDEFIKILGGLLLSSTDDEGNISISIAEVEQKVREHFNKLTEDELELISDELRSIYEQVYNDSAKSLGIEADFSLLRQEFVDSAINTPIDGARFSDRIWNNSNTLATRIYNDILEGVRTGESPEKIARRIRKDFGSTAYEAKRLVNTEMARVASEAALEVYRNSGVVKKVMWMATLETNTCEYCGNLDGKKFEIDDIPKIPAHPNCRCCYVPVIDGYEPKKRVVNDKSTDSIDYKTYNQWANGN